MELTISNIIALFYFGYWIVHNSQPFSIWWLVALYFGLYILQIILTSIIKGASYKIESETRSFKEDIDNFNRRLVELERKDYEKEEKF